MILGILEVQVYPEMSEHDPTAVPVTRLPHPDCTCQAMAPWLCRATCKLRMGAAQRNEGRCEGVGFCQGWAGSSPVYAACKMAAGNCSGEEGNGVGSSSVRDMSLVFCLIFFLSVRMKVMRSSTCSKHSLLSAQDHLGLCIPSTRYMRICTTHLFVSHAAMLLVFGCHQDTCGRHSPTQSPACLRLCSLSEYAVCGVQPTYHRAENLKVCLGCCNGWVRMMGINWKAIQDADVGPSSNPDDGPKSAS